MPRFLTFAAVQALICLSIFQAAHAASYVGCFPAASFAAATTSAASLGACEQQCESAQMPLLGMVGGKCACTPLLPTAAAVADALCASGDAAAVAVYYRNADATKGCRLAPAPFNPDVWTVAGPEDQVVFDGENGVRLALVGVDGSRLNTADKTGYGLYTVRAKVSKEVGCVSAFYTSSDPSNANRDQDEVDYEFINAHPSPGATGLWPNTYINGAVQGPEKVKLVTDATSEYRSHTFNWQPSGITWYVDGTQWDFKAAPVPSKPQVILLSIWTMNSKDFGGVLPSLDHPPYFSYFKDVVRLVCDLPEPKVLSASSMAAQSVPAPEPAPALVLSPSPAPVPSPEPAAAPAEPTPSPQPIPEPALTNSDKPAEGSSLAVEAAAANTTSTPAPAPEAEKAEAVKTETEEAPAPVPAPSTTGTTTTTTTTTTIIVPLDEPSSTSTSTSTAAGGRIVGENSTSSGVIQAVNSSAASITANATRLANSDGAAGPTQLLAGLYGVLMLLAALV